MKKIVLFAFLLFYSVSTFCQDNKIIIGFDLGLFQNLTTIKNDNTGVFIPNQKLSYNIHENILHFYFKYKHFFNYKLQYSRAVYTCYICNENNFLYPFKGKDCSGYDFNGHQLNLNFGKDFYLIKRIFFTPYIGFGVVKFSDFDADYREKGSSAGGGKKWHYTFDERVYRNNNINGNLTIEICFEVNPILNIKLFYAYQKAFFKLYENNIIAWQPSDPEIFEIPKDESKLEKLNNSSYGSNTQFGLGFEFKLLTLKNSNK
jgi:hypothetical protein